METIPIEKIRVSDLNIRAETGFGDEEDKELVENIGSLGMLHPIIVRPVGDIYEVYSGRRRFLAAKESGLTEISCSVKDVDDLEAMDISFCENVQRKNVDPVTLGKWVDKRLELEHISLRELARKVKISASILSDWHSTVKLSPAMQSEVQCDTVPLREALKVVRMNLTPDEERVLAEESRSGGYKAFKAALDRVSANHEKRGAPKGLHITRINWGLESPEYEELNRLAESEGLDHSEYCQKVLTDHIQAQTQA